MSTSTNLPSNVSVTHALAGWYDDPTSYGQTYWDGSAWTEHHRPHRAPAVPSTPAQKRRRVWAIGGVAVTAVVVGLGGLTAAAVASDVRQTAPVSRQFEDAEVDFSGHATDAIDAMIAHDQKKVDGQLPSMAADAGKVRDLSTKVSDSHLRHGLSTEADAMGQLITGLRENDQAAFQRAMHLSNDALKELHAYDENVTSNWSQQ